MKRRDFAIFVGSFTFSFFAWFLLIVALTKDVGAAIIVTTIFSASVLTHELGHFLALRSLGASAGIIFLPFVAATTGDITREINSSPEDLLKVDLAGPVASWLAMLTAFCLWWATKWDVAYVATLVNSLLAFATLLPLPGCDEGQVAKHLRWITNQGGIRRLIWFLSFSSGLIALYCIEFLIALSP